MSTNAWAMRADRQPPLSIAAGYTVARAQSSPLSAGAELDSTVAAGAPYRISGTPSRSASSLGPSAARRPRTPPSPARSPPPSQSRVSPYGTDNYAAVRIDMQARSDRRPILLCLAVLLYRRGSDRQWCVEVTRVRMTHCGHLEGSEDCGGVDQEGGSYGGASQFVR